METQTPNAATSRHGLWSSRLVFILVAAGAAIGLGNIWKFPFMAGANGGAAFILVYLACIAFIGVPVLMAEVMLGRRGRLNPVASLKQLALDADASVHWRLLGYLGALTLLLIFSFYSVISGWTFAYIKFGWSGAFNDASPDEVATLFTDFLANPKMLLLWHTAFIAMSLYTVLFGVQRGLERVIRFVMPLMLILLGLLVIYAVIAGDWMAGMRFLFTPDFSQVTYKTVIAAMGQALFTLAVGASAMMVYGAYLPKNVPMGSTLLTIAGLDTAIALMAGLAIFPIVFAYALSPAEGPGLVFVTLPIAFGQMPWGQFFAGIFFLLLLFAAWTSALSFAEPLTMLLIERFKISRKKAAMIVGFIAWALGIGTLLSFNVWADYKLFGHWDFFTAIDGLASNILLPIGALLFAVFAGWVMKRDDSHDELALSRQWQYRLWRFLIRYVAPISILIIFASPLIL